MIQIKKNDYVQPTEVREEVVQAICEAFIYGAENPYHIGHTYYPFSEGAYRGATFLVVKPTRKGVVNVFSFENKGRDSDIVHRFNGAEMRAAFEELIKAGYYMFKVYAFGSWMGYKCSKKPFMQGGTRVKSFEDFID